MNDHTLKRRVFAEIDRLSDDLVRMVGDLVRFPTTVGQEEAAQKYVAEQLKEMGASELDLWYPDLEELRKHPAFMSDRADFSTSPCVVGVFRGTGGGRSMILNGHMDVAPVTGAWTHDPWGGEVVGDQIYGRGAGDMKGGIAANLVAIKAIHNAGVRLRGDVQIHSVVDEEIGGMGSLAAIVRGYKADAVMIPECTDTRIVTTNAGSAWVRMTVTGKAAILANAHRGVNAIKKCMYLYDKLDELDMERKVKLSHPMLSHIPNPYKINVGKMTAGVFPSGIPDRAVMEIRYGITPYETVEQAKKTFEDYIDSISEDDPWLKEHKPVVEWMNCCWYPSSTALDDPLVQMAKANADIVLDGQAQVVGAAFGSDAGLYANYLNIPYILIGPGRLAEAHAPDEWVSIAETLKVAKITAATLMDWCGCEEVHGPGFT